MKGYIITAIVTMILTIIILKVIKKKVDAKKPQTVENFKALVKTKEFENFLLTPQGKALMKTPQFKKLGESFIIESLANLV